MHGSFALFVAWAFVMTWSVLAMEAAACYIGECREPTDAKIAMVAEGGYGCSSTSSPRSSSSG